MGKRFVAGFLAAILIVAAAAAVGVLVFDLKIEKDNDPHIQAVAEVPDTEVKELYDGDTAIVYYCTEDRGPKAMVDYTTAVDRLVGVARAYPTAAPVVNEFELAYTPEPPTMVQRLTDEADLIRRKCGEPRSLGEDQIWERDVEYLQEVAQQLAVEVVG